MIPIPLFVLVCSALVLAPLAVGQSESPQDGVPSQAAATPEGLTADDWSSIRRTYEAERHAVHPVDGGHRARNPGQQWSTIFDGRGFTVEPDAGGWSWGLELLRYGFPEREHSVTVSGSVTADGQRVAYDWDDTVTEWFVNDSRGLEHGYTVHRQPEHDTADSTLSFRIAVRGDLTPEVADDGRSIGFLDSTGAVALTYSALTVFDADRNTIPAWFEHVAEGEGPLRLTVDVRGARYPLTIDPVAQQAYLKASNTDLNDGFGYALAVSENTAVVGAWTESSSATGVNGDQSDNSATDAGAAYVFVRTGTTWSQEAYLKASNAEAFDHFGSSVSVSGDTVVVGAWSEASSATGVNGDQIDNSATDAGAAYVFVRTGTTWSQQAYLKPSNTDAGDRFGVSVSASSNTVVIGSFLEDSNSTGVNGNQTNNSADSGAAFVFVRTGTTWSQEAYLKASNTDSSDYFGAAVALSGDTAVVGAYREDSNATGVNGDQSDNTTTGSGAVYVFVRAGTTWSQEAYLKASNSDAGDRFGISTSLSGNTVVIGAFQEDSPATGVNGNQNLNLAGDSGAAYVFVRSGTTWIQEAYLKASNTDAFDNFGFSVAASGDVVVVGAWREDSNATGVNGNPGDNSASDAGAAYVFVRSGTTWSQQAYLKASNAESLDQFGWSTAVSGDIVVVGAYLEDSGASGVNGDDNDNGATGAGAGYLFDIADINPNVWVNLGNGLAGTSGIPSLVGDGSLTGGSTVSLDLSGAKVFVPSTLVLGLSNISVPFKSGVLVPMPDFLLPFFSNGLGEVNFSTPWPVGVPPSLTFYVQFWISDSAGVGGFAASNAVSGTTQ